MVGLVTLMIILTRERLPQKNLTTVFLAHGLSVCAPGELQAPKPETVDNLDRLARTCYNVTKELLRKRRCISPGSLDSRLVRTLTLAIRILVGHPWSVYESHGSPHGMDRVTDLLV